MAARPLTPPEETAHVPHSNVQLVEGEDSLKEWLRNRGLHIDSLLSQHNRISVPIEEDIRVLSSLKSCLEQSAGNVTSQEAATSYFQDHKQGAQTLQKRADAASYNLILAPLPNDQACEMLSFLRCRSSNSAAFMISRILPYLLDQALHLSTTESNHISGIPSPEKHSSRPVLETRQSNDTTPSRQRKSRVQKAVKQGRAEKPTTKQAPAYLRPVEPTILPHLRRSNRLRVNRSHP